MDAATVSSRASNRLSVLSRILHGLPVLPPLCSNLMIRSTRSSPSDAETKTASRSAGGSSLSGMVRAAVLVCLFQSEAGDLRVILIKRASTLSSHAGEVALPGGKREPGDADDVDTALRESQEEIGLDPSLVQVVNVLPPCVSVRGISVVPVIALLKDRNKFNPILDPTEVELILDAPLEMFLKDKDRRKEEIEVKGHRCLLHYFDYDTSHQRFVIFAFTAAVLIMTASVVYGKEPEFVVRSPKLWH